MSVKASSWAWDADCGPKNGAKFVLLALADHADEEGRCWPSQSRLAQKTGLSVDTVQRRLADLEAAGLIRREHRTRARGGKASNLYRLLLQGQLNLQPLVPDDGIDDAELAEALDATDAADSGIDDTATSDTAGCGIGGNGGNQPKPAASDTATSGIAIPQPAGGYTASSAASRYRTAAASSEPSLPNQGIEKENARPRDPAQPPAEPPATVFVREEHTKWFKPLEARWLADHPDKRSMPRTNLNGYPGWWFPKDQIDNVRDRDGKVLRK